jgi:putative DNA methylase
MPPVNPESRKQKNFSSNGWKGAQGLAEDVRYYGKWMRDEAEKCIGHLYPKVEITEEMTKERPDLEQYVGQKLTVIAWIWARTVKSQNPAFAHVDVPLASTFMLSKKKGKEAYIEPVFEGDSYEFKVKLGKPENTDITKRGTKLARGANFECLMSGSLLKPDYIKSEGMAGRMGVRMMAIIAEGNNEKVYLPPNEVMENAANQAKPEWGPDLEISPDRRSMFTPLYGLTHFKHLFTPRQLVALTTFSNLVMKAQEQIKQNALESGMAGDALNFIDGGNGAQAYSDAVAMYLGFGVGRSANYWSSLTPWGGEFIVQTFGRPSIPMVWDYAEANPFSNSTGNWTGALKWIERVIIKSLSGFISGRVIQSDAQNQSISNLKVISTDPPYYDNIGYADLSDYFYVWLRRSLKPIFYEIFTMISVPKTEELVAIPYRHGGKKQAESFFMGGMKKAMHCLAEQARVDYPVTIYYAFKQSESEKDGTASTGWETFLEAIIQAGFALTGTWPMRTERSQGLKTGTNSLASSIVLVCRKRNQNAPIATRREFLNQLKVELPEALKHLQHGNIAPVDLAQAAIGPGMAVFTRYSKVINAEGNAMTVREALALINQILDEVLAEQEGDFDADSRWALSWFEQYGFAEGEYGVAETLSKAKNTSVSGLVDAGILASKAGKVHLLRPEELPEDWDPAKDERLTVWEMVHHLIRVLEAGGEIAAAELVAKLGSKADVARELAYRLYTQCERKKRAQEALAYNSLVQSWPEIVRLAKDEIKLPKGQTKLTDE